MEWPKDSEINSRCCAWLATLTVLFNHALARTIGAVLSKTPLVCDDGYQDIGTLVPYTFRQFVWENLFISPYPDSARVKRGKKERKERKTIG